MTTLFIILGIILFFILLLSIPVVVDMEYIDTFKLKVSWLFIKFNILPKDETKKKKEKKQKKPKKEKEKKEEPEKEEPEKEESSEPKDNPIKIFYEDQGVLGIIDLINNCASYLGKFTKAFIRSFYIKRLRLRMWVTEGDAAQTAIKYGKFCQMIYPPLGYICSSCRVKDYDVNIWAEYCGDKTKGEFETTIALIPRKVINAGMALVFRLVARLLKALLAFIKAKKKNNKLKGGQEQ